MTGMRQTCTDHATCCGQHFHGLGAFDAHRAGGICRDAGDVTYRTGKRTGENVLQVWTDDGYCDKMRGCWVDGKRVQHEHPVTVWQIATTDEQRSRLQGAWGSQGDESDAQMGFAL